MNDAPGRRTGQVWQPATIAVLLCMAVSNAVGGAHDNADTQPVVVAALKGDVTAWTDAQRVSLTSGARINTPVILRTGADGAIELHQGLSVVSMAPNSELELPRSTDPEETLDRVIQKTGSILYSVAPRPAHKLHVETPQLVAVIKGTRFNILSTERSVTLSLLEGSVEIDSRIDDTIVDLKSGQIASVSQDRKGIEVIPMATGQAFHAGPATVASNAESAIGSQTALPGGVTLGDDHGASGLLALKAMAAQATQSQTASTGGGGAPAGNSNSGGGHASSNGGTSSSGGTVSTGGSASSSGGTVSTGGGASSSGGTVSTGGGASSSGGTVSTGGGASSSGANAVSTGSSASSSGGTVSTGSSASSSGGTVSTGSSASSSGGATTGGTTGNSKSSSGSTTASGSSSTHGSGSGSGNTSLENLLQTLLNEIEALASKSKK